MPIPVATSVSKGFVGFVYKFGGKSYYDINKLIPAMATNWAEGKEHFESKVLSGFFSSHDTEIAIKITAVEKENQRGANSDVAFWKLLYKIAPNIRACLKRSILFLALYRFLS